MASVVDRLRARLPPAPEDFRSPVHDAAVVARIGVWLGISFGICFLTGLVSHYHQHPLPFFVIPPWPLWGYRVTQGAHVVTGLACVPLLLAKLFAVYPRLFERPMVGPLLRVVERGSIAVLVASAILQVVTGVMNVAQWYVFGFGFIEVHFALAWVSIGAMLVHIAVKLPVIRAELGVSLGDGVPAAAARDRRWFVWGAVAVGGGVVLTSVGHTWRPLEQAAFLSKRHPSREQFGVPVNRTADQAAIGASTAEDGWELMVTGPGGRRTLGYLDLMAMPQVSAELPIACVEGWSASAAWTGVRVRDLAALVGGVGQGRVRVTSLERRGSYRVSELPTAYAANDQTLLALRLNGTRLTRDHGFPARIIAPNRPGVLQTKWVRSLEVLT